MHILFVQPPIARGGGYYAMYPPLGLMYMSSVLRQEGHEVSFIDGMLEDYDAQASVKKVRALQPDIIGITVNAMQVKYSKEYIREIRANHLGFPIVVGGPFVTAAGTDIFRCMEGIDYAIVGEGEYAMLDLVRHLEGKCTLEEVKNLVYNWEGAIKQNKVERITDIDALPLPDYDLVNSYIDKYTGAFPSIAKPSFHVMCTRGCPFSCKFCSSPVTWHSKVTYRKVSSVVEEVEMLAKRYGAQEIFFQDDTLNLREYWFNELCDLLISSGLSKKVYFKAPFRVNKKLVDKDILMKAKQANFWMLFYGVESGSQMMLDSMRKGTKIDEIARAFDLTAEAGIKTFASFIVGCPGETAKTVQDSYELVRKIAPDFWWVCNCNTLPWEQAL